MTELKLVHSEKILIQVVFVFQKVENKLNEWTKWWLPTVSHFSVMLLKTFYPRIMKTWNLKEKN